jgi:hypothetical protein
MIHLRRFNESHYQDQIVRTKQLDEFCKDSLAYLLDDKLSIGYSYYGDVVYKDLPYKKSIYMIIISNLDRTNLKWDDIKDHFIPFLERLSSRYKLYGFDEEQDYVKFNYQKSQSFNLNSIISGNVPLNYFWSILLKVEI